MQQYSTLVPVDNATPIKGNDIIIKRKQYGITSHNINLTQ